MKKQAVITETSAVTAPIFALSEKAAAMAALEIGSPTLQTIPGEKLGRAWRAAGYQKPNTRVAALAAILAAHATFTAAEAQATLKASGVNLGTGTPRSYVVAFIKNGYFV